MPGLLFLLLFFSFALWGVHSYFLGGGASNIVASVNGVDITTQQVASAYERLRQQIQAQYGANAINSSNQNAIKNQALRSLIEMQALSQSALSQGFVVSEQQIDNYLQAMPEFKVNNVFSLERFQNVLAASQLSVAEFLDLIKTSLLIEQPKVGVVFTSFALPQETDYTIQLINQDRSLGYIKLNFADFLKLPFTVPSSDIQKYYDSHKADFMTPEQVKVEYLELNLEEIGKTLFISEDDVKHFYQENASSYMSQPAWQLKGIVLPYSAKEATEEQIAATHAQAEKVYQNLLKANSPANALAMVTVPHENYHFASVDFMELNLLPSALQAQLLQATKPNMLLAPVQTEKGYLIAQVVAYREAKIEPYESVKERVRANYTKLKAEEKFAEMKEKLADLTYENPTSLVEAAKALNLPVKQSNYFALEKTGSGIAQYKKVRNAAFSGDVLNVKNNSDVLMLDNSKAIVLRVNAHLPASLLPLASASKSIEDKLKKQWAEQKAASLADELVRKLQGGEAQSEIAKQYHAKWQDTGFVGRYTTKADAAILEAAFRLPNIGETPKHPYYAQTRLADGFAVIALYGVKEGVSNDTKQANIFAEQVQSGDGLLEYELYKQSQINQAKVKTYN